MNAMTIQRRRQPRKDRPAFVERVREIVSEYMVAGLGPSAAMAEIRAALREIDRREARQGERGR